MGNVNILEKRMIKYEVSVKQTAKFIMMLLILSLAYVMPAATTKKIQQVSTVPKKTLTVLLDAGHGADDSGKVGINQVFEKDINLEIAKYVKEFLEKEEINVVMTREDDSPLYQSSERNKKLADMKKRIQIMVDCDADIAVSIHQNSYTQESVKGPQVFYYKDSAEGKKLAASIQEAFDLVIGDENTRTIKPNGEYYLLVHSPMPLVICECGFLSNWEEAKLLATPTYQKSIAKAICQGILEYLANEKRL